MLGPLPPLLGAQPGRAHLVALCQACQPLFRATDAQQPAGRAHQHQVHRISGRQEQFLTSVARCTDVSEPQQIAIFMAGLSNPLCLDVELLRPSSLEDAMGLARTFERRLCY